MVSSRVRPLPSLLQNRLTPIWISPHMVPSKVFHPFSQKCHLHRIYSQRTIWNTPFISYISFQFKDKLPYVSVLIYNFYINQTHIARISFLILLDLKCHSSINKWIVTFSLQLPKDIWITFNSHGYHPQLVLENWNIPLLGA